MKVLYISRRFYPEIKGGGQISAFYIAKSVKEAGHSVVVCTFHDKPTIKEDIEGISVYRLKLPQIKLFPKFSNMDFMYVQMARLASKIIKETNPDIIHLLNFESIPISAIYYKKKFKKPIVATVNGPGFGCFTLNAIDYKGNTCVDCRVFKRFLCSTHNWGSLRGSLYYIYSVWYMNMLKLSYKYVDRFLIISKAMAPLLTSMGVDNAKIALVNNLIGVDLKSDEKKLSSLKRKYNGKRVFCAGRLTEDKGVQYVISAMTYLPNAYLLIAGWGDYKKRLKELAEKLKLSNRVLFLGKLSVEEMGTYYKLSDIFAHFPTYYEPFGRTLIEAMSFGKPVVAYPIAGIKDIVETEHNGLLVNSRDPELIADNIKRLFNNKKMYKKLSLNAKKTVAEKFSNRVVANNYINQYNTVLKK